MSPHSFRGIYLLEILVILICKKWKNDLGDHYFLEIFISQLYLNVCWKLLFCSCNFLSPVHTCKFSNPTNSFKWHFVQIVFNPFSHLQVGLMLRGMGFSNSTSIYLASGKIYNAEKTMAPLLEMFPNLQTKETLASEEELAPFMVQNLCSSPSIHHHV